MLSREEKFAKLESDPWYGKIYKSLTVKDLNFCYTLIKNTDNLTKGEYIKKVHNTFLLEDGRGKNWKKMIELLEISS